MNDVADLNMKLVEETLETSHFEMSELNALAARNTAESKKKRREKQRAKMSNVRQIVKILEQRKKEENTWGKGF